jgi:hypothetical protein
MAKDKLPIIITPKGTAAWAWLNKKDEKFGDKYKITVALDKKDMAEGRLNFGKEVVAGKDWVKALLAQCKEHGVPSKVGEKGCPVKDGDKRDNDDFRGMLLITAKSDYKPKVVNVKGEPIPRDETVFSGDIVKVAIQPKHYNVNGNDFLSLYISQVMLIEKGERSSGLDFGAEEGYSETSGDEVDFGADDDGDDNSDF